MKRTVTVSMDVDVTIDPRAFTPAVLAAFEAREPSLVTIEDHICAIAEYVAGGDEAGMRRAYRGIAGIEAEVIGATVGSEIGEVW